jgi:DUF1680 family protein
MYRMYTITYEPLESRYERCPNQCEVVSYRETPGFPVQETCDISDFIHSNTWLLRQTGNSTYGDRLEKAFFNAAPAAVNRAYTQHVYYQSANLASIPRDFHEYGENISRRWDMNQMHTPPCCTGNQVRAAAAACCHQINISRDFSTQLAVCPWVAMAIQGVNHRLDDTD